MPPTKTLSAAEVLRSASSKPKSKTSAVRAQTQPKTAATNSTLSATQFLQAAAKKTRPTRANKASQSAQKTPDTSTSSTRSLTPLTAENSPTHQGAKRVQKVADVKVASKTSLKKTFNPEKVVAKQPASRTVSESKVSVRENLKPKSISGKTQAAKPDLPKITAASTNIDAPTSVSAIKTVKAKRSRVPKDFATTYGENIKERKAEAVPIKERRARKTAQQREQRRALMTPDDDILQRLARVQTVSISSANTPKRRSKKWESRCGKCGIVTTYSTIASLCSRCGAIAVRVLD